MLEGQGDSEGGLGVGTSFFISGPAELHGDEGVEHAYGVGLVVTGEAASLPAAGPGIGAVCPGERPSPTSG
jgi:hypothetical protein